MKKLCIKIFKILIKILIETIKFIIMLPIYCMMPDKYNGIDYDDWLKK